jgi:hypothetical protein
LKKLFPLLFLLLLGCGNDSKKREAREFITAKESSTLSFEDMNFHFRIESSGTENQIDCIASASVVDSYNPVRLSGSDSVSCDGQKMPEHWVTSHGFKILAGYRLSLPKKANNTYRVTFAREGVEYKYDIKIPSENIRDFSSPTNFVLKSNEKLVVNWNQLLSEQEIRDGFTRSVSIMGKKPDGSYRAHYAILENDQVTFEKTPAEWDENETRWPANTDFTLYISNYDSFRSPLKVTTSGGQQKTIRLRIVK